MENPLNIVIDTREQTPWAWESHLVHTTVQGLYVCDYALAEDTVEVPNSKRLRVSFAIERKNLDDFLGTIGSGWETFSEELKGMEDFPARIIIVEGDFESCCFHEEMGIVFPPDHNHSQITPQFASKRIGELLMMGVSVLFAGNAHLAAALAYVIFKQRSEQNNGT